MPDPIPDAAALGRAVQAIRVGGGISQIQLSENTGLMQSWDQQRRASPATELEQGRPLIPHGASALCGANRVRRWPRCVAMCRLRVHLLRRPAASHLISAHRTPSSRGALLSRAYMDGAR